MKEPLFEKSSAGVSLVISIIASIFVSLAWMLDKVVTLDEKVSQFMERQERVDDRVKLWLAKGLELDEQVIKNTATLEMLHEILNGLKSNADYN